MDPMSGKGVPTASQWSEMIQAKGLTMSPPDHLWLMQEASGNLADAIGSAALVPSISPRPTYANSVPGWSRIAVGTLDTQPNQGFGNATVGSLDGTSHLLLLYVSLYATPSMESSICGIGNETDHRYVAVTAPPTIAFEGTGYAMSPTVGAMNPGTLAHPIVLAIDMSHSRYTVYSDLEKIAVAWRPPNSLGPLVTIGNAIIHGAPARYLYGAMWSGTKAELSDAAVKSLLEALGWTVTGY